MASAGTAITQAIRNRITRSLTTFAGRDVQVYVNAAGADNTPEGLTPEQMWRTQPHLRTVVDFLARNVAQLGLHSFKVDGDDRVRDRDSDVAQILCRRPNSQMTAYDLIYDLVGNIALYNRAYLFIYPDSQTGKPIIQPFPAPWVGVEYDSFFRVKHYIIQPPNVEGKKIYMEPDSVVAFDCWNPTYGDNSSPVETLRLILEEQHHSRVHRLQVWKRNGRVGSYLTRPAGAPEWDKNARQRFYSMFEAFVGDKGERAGGTPLLEDGMELKRVGFNSADEQWSESVKISLATVAQVYQVNPAMVGDLEATNYSNMKEFNKGLYTNTLGPTLRMLEERLNVFLLPMLGAPEGTFVEFNVAAKLKGSFEEQASVTSTSVGGPWMTRNEARKMNNLPAVDGGDELITPLNVLIGGQASPQDGGDGEGDALKSLVSDHFERIKRIYPSKGFDIDRFDRELEADLSKAGITANAHEINLQIQHELEGSNEN